MPTEFVLTVMSLDRVGIVAGMAGAIAELGGNIEAISQTVLQGYFTIIVTVRFEQELAAEELARAVRQSGARGELEVSVKPREVSEPRPVVNDAQRLILTISGPDRKGIIQRVCSYLATRGINVEDLYAYSEGKGFLLIAQLQAPPDLEVERVQIDVQSLWEEGLMRVSLQHENIFLATNQVDFHQLL